MNANKLLNCPLCGSKSKFLFESKLKKNIFKCENKKCSHLFTPINELNQGVCQRIKDLELESDQFLRDFKGRNKRLTKFLLKNICSNKKNISILDYGSGNAHLPRVMREIIPKESVLYALDAVKEYDSFYEKFGLIPIKDIDNIKPNSLDLVIMTEVLEHIVNPIETLKSLKSKLKSDGKIFITTPGASETESDTNAFDTVSHLHFFTEQSFEKLIKDCGFNDFSYLNPKVMQPQFFETPFDKNKILRLYGRSKETIKKIITNYYLKKILKRSKTKNNRKRIYHIIGFAQ